MYAAASKPGGAAGVSQSVAKEFVKDDPGGKLPEKAPKKRKGLSYKSMD
jgi:hypothetical protein